MSPEDVAVPGHERAVADDFLASLRRERPGWLTRIFGIETARLVACDAVRHGDIWEPPRTRLYAGGPGSYFELDGVRDWCCVDAEEARRIFRGLPVKLVMEREIFETQNGVELEED